MTLKTARDCINALDGPSWVASRLGLDQSTVSSWGSRGEIGGGWGIYILFSLLARGYRKQDIPAKAFGPESWDEIIIPPRKRPNSHRS